jgi:hypothetical protein
MFSALNSEKTIQRPFVFKKFSALAAFLENGHLVGQKFGSVDAGHGA